MEKKKGISTTFDDMFGDAQEYIPDPDTIDEKEFASLDEEDAGGEDELGDLDLEGIEAALDEALEGEDDEEDIDYGYADDEEEDDEEDSEEDDVE